jgi:hypothetical protein
MFTRIKKNLAILATCAVAGFALAQPVVANENPFTTGNYWEVTGIHIKDGSSLAYAQFLAAEWRANQEFSKSKGWIKDYFVLGNSYPRKGEPDVYLITVFETMASTAEAEKRDAEFREWRKKTITQMQKESGDRAVIRELGSSMLLQELKFK